jgi:uncharacterized protein (TIGR02145 family)
VRIFGYAQCALFAPAKTLSARICQNYPVPPYSKDFQMKRFAILFAALFGAAGAFAQNDTAYVPFVVNVAATVRAVPASGTTAVVTQVQMSVAANTQTTLKIPLPKSTGVLNGAQRQANVPAVISNGGGKVTLNLPAQSYKNAEIALYAVNGKRILRNNVSASSAANTISRKNAAPGAYLLSVTGADGGVFTNRLTHNGGNLDITVALGGEHPSIAQQLAKETAAGDWTVTVSATGRVDSTYTLTPGKGTMPVQNITLNFQENSRRGSATLSGNTLTDVDDGKTYRTVVIGGKRWTAENLNYAIDGSWCYDNDTPNCNTYGRYYNWNDARKVCPSGWHLPSDSEWGTLADFVGESTAGTQLRASSGWDVCCNVPAGTDAYGFSALPGGYRHAAAGCVFEGFRGYWWTNDDNAGFLSDAAMRAMSSNFEDVSRQASGKSNGLSVRCVAD